MENLNKICFSEPKSICTTHPWNNIFYSLFPLCLCFKTVLYKLHKHTHWKSNFCQDIVKPPGKTPYLGIPSFPANLYSYYINNVLNYYIVCKYSTTPVTRMTIISPIIWIVPVCSGEFNKNRRVLGKNLKNVMGLSFTFQIWIYIFKW